LTFFRFLEVPFNSKPVTQIIMIMMRFTHHGCPSGEMGKFNNPSPKLTGFTFNP
jgi:hypothetical protein